mmetsp:Transcript_30936/g.30415  ORF Transcript_30936/g.30415 Transcript_30936/m.30415 type:complete len:159 (+) Transcript_30936:1818-2294(+)
MSNFFLEALEELEAFEELVKDLEVADLRRQFHPVEAVLPIVDLPWCLLLRSLMISLLERKSIPALVVASAIYVDLLGGTSSYRSWSWEVLHLPKGQCWNHHFCSNHLYLSKGKAFGGNIVPELHLLLHPDILLQVIQEDILDLLWVTVRLLQSLFQPI